MKGKILLFSAGALGLFLLSRAKAIKETVRFLEYTPGDVSLKFEGLVPVLHIRLDIYNPNKTSVPVSGILGKIYFKGRSVATFTNTDKVNINDKESTSVNMKIRLSLFNAVVALLTKETNKVLEIDGLIKTVLKDIPFGYSYDLTRKTAVKKPQAEDIPHEGVGRSRFLKALKPLPLNLLRKKKKGVGFIDAFHPDTFKQTA